MGCYRQYINGVRLGNRTRLCPIRTAEYYGRIGSGEAPNGDGVLWENDVAIVGFHRTDELRQVSSMY